MTARPVAPGAGVWGSRARRALRWTAAIVGALAALMLAAALAAPLVIRGARFGRMIERVLPPVRGQIHVGGGHGSWRTIYAVAVGRPAPIALDDVVIVDPEGVEVLRIARVRGEIELHRGELWQIKVGNVHVEGAAWRFATMKTERKVGLAAALLPKPASPQGQQRQRAPQRPGAASAAGAELVVSEAELEHVTTTFNLPAWGLVLQDGRGTGSLYVRTSKGTPPVFRFEVRGADIAGGGKLRVLGGRWSFVLPFSRGRLEHVATAADQPDHLRLEASGVETGASTLALAATFQGVYGLTPASRQPGLALEARVENAADAVQAIAQSEGYGRLPPLGPGARVALRLEGPFTAPHGSVSLESAALGRFEASGAVEARTITGALGFRAFQLGRVLPPPLVPFAGGRLDGHLRGHFDLDGPSTLDDMALALTRPAQASPNLLRLRAGNGHFDRPKPGGAWELDLTQVGYREGTIHIPELSVPIYGGRVSASGEVVLRNPDGKRWLPSPEVDLHLGADGFALNRLLGTRFVVGEPTLRARVRGPLARLRARVTVPRRSAVGIVGQRFVLPPRFDVLVTDETLVFDGVRLEGPEASAVEASGRVSFAGRVGMRVHLDAFPLSRIPGLAATNLPLKGRISGDLQFAGGPELPRITGQLAFAAITFQGRTLGGGSVAILEGPNGGIRGRGQLIPGVEASGELIPGAAGLAGQATIELERLPLDPFLPLLPGAVHATGLVSGRVSVRLPPGSPPQAEGQLRELSLVFTPPPRKGKPAPRFELHADHEIHLAAQAAGGPITIGPARFRGDGGTVELYGESRGDKLQASVRGRIELGALAPLLSPWLDRVSGSVDVDLMARPGDGPGGVNVTGKVGVAGPIGFRLASMPMDGYASAGHLTLDGHAVETRGFAVGLRADKLAGEAVRNFEAFGRIDARVSGSFDAPVASARIAIDRMSATVPALGTRPIVSEGGHVAVESRGHDAVITDVDLPVRGRAQGISRSGVRVDDATFALRIAGAPGRRLALAGEVELLAARVNAAAARKGGQAGPGAATGGGPPWMRPEVENAGLDVRLRSRPGAVVVDVPHMPDLRVNLDMHVGGTVKRPVITGEPSGANVYSRFVLGLARLFR